MPRTLFSLPVIAALLVAAAPMAQAYATEPVAGELFAVVMGQEDVQTAQLAETCTLKVSPLLAEVIGLAPDWREGPAGATTAALACADE